MNKEQYLSEIETRLRSMFAASKEGYKASLVDRHRLEGFMQAGVFLKLVTNRELEERMDAIHRDIFGISIQERKAKNPARWQDEIIDYTAYDAPAYERKA